MHKFFSDSAQEAVRQAQYQIDGIDIYLVHELIRLAVDFIVYWEKKKHDIPLDEKDSVNKKLVKIFLQSAKEICRKYSKKDEFVTSVIDVLSQELNKP